MKPLSIMLREGTMDSHRAAEQTEFVKAFLKGNISRNAYARHLSLLKIVYDALERNLRTSLADPCAAKIYFPELLRADQLSKDLAYFAAATDTSSADSSPATDRYASRLNELGASKPWLLPAHSYVRYMGDLSGGQALKRVAAKALDLTSDGLQFYEFPAISDIAAFKTAYREALDSLPLNTEQKQELVQEAVHAFDLNTGIFHDLEPLVQRALQGNAP